MKKLLILISILPNLTFASCDDFFNSRAKEINLGSLQSNKCGANIKIEEKTKRMSFSTKKGRKDNGPTLRLSIKDSGDIEIKQLLMKDLTTKHKIEYSFKLNNDCSELKEVIYKIPGKQADLNYSVCEDPSSFYTDLQLSELNVEKLCSKFMPLMKLPSATPKSFDKVQGATSSIIE